MKERDALSAILEAVEQDIKKAAVRVCMNNNGPDTCDKAACDIRYTIYIKCKVLLHKRKSFDYILKYAQKTISNIKNWSQLYINITNTKPQDEICYGDALDVMKASPLNLCPDTFESNNSVSALYGAVKYILSSMSPHKRAIVLDYLDKNNGGKASCEIKNIISEFRLMLCDYCFQNDIDIFNKI